MLKTLFQQFFDKYNGQFVEVSDPSNLNQCFDLAFAWCTFIGIPMSAIRHLYAYQIYTEPTVETKKYFKIIENTPDGVPQVGDLVIFGKKLGIAGHVCIANGVGDTKTFQSLDQNWGTTQKEKRTQIVTHNYIGCLGWLRPIVIIETPLQDRTIDWDDFEGKRKAVKWYVNEWWVEKEKNISLLDKYAKEMQEKQNHIESLQKSASEMNLQLVSSNKQISIIANEKDALRTQLGYASEQLDILRADNAKLTQKLDELQVKIEKLEARLNIVPKDNVTFNDIIEVVKKMIKR